MSDCSEKVGQQFAEVNGLNSKLAYDAAAQLQLQAQLDNQLNARAYAQLNLRNATNAATLDHLATLGLIQAGQTGFTENQQEVTPAAQAVKSVTEAGAAVAAEQVAANIADLATALVPAISAAVSEAVTTALTALLPVIVTASGGASTPSQTQAKPVA